jgi:hypothetical protein
MRKLRQNPEESLDLLLDTLCNVFGGIILISCLLALLTHKPAPAGPAGGASAEIKGRLLAERQEAAEKELAGLQAVLAKHRAAGDEDLQKLLAEREQLRVTQKSLRENSLTDVVDDGSDHDPTGDVAKLRGEVKALDLQAADAKARTQAADAKGRDLAAKLQRLRTQIDANDSKNVEYVRFPRERTTSKVNANVVLQFGEVFPLEDANGKHFAGLVRDPPDSDRFSAIPQKSRGWTLKKNRAELQSLLAYYKRSGCYIAFYIYPDSFECFRELKELIFASELEYGFEVLPDHFILRLVPDGTSPAPL